jgi:hypothetical protein
MALSHLFKSFPNINFDGNVESKNDMGIAGIGN